MEKTERENFHSNSNLRHNAKQHTSMVDFHQEVGNRARKPFSADRSDLVCIGKIPIHMPGKCCQCTPVETQVRLYLFITLKIMVFNETNIYPHEANQFTVTDGFIRFVNGWRAIRRMTIAEARVATAVVISTLFSETKSTLAGTARTLKRKVNKALKVNVIHCVITLYMSISKLPKVNLTGYRLN